MGLVTTTVLVGSLAGGLPTDAATIILDLGPDHPSRTGLLELELTTTGDTVSSAHIKPGAMHRGVEKLFEVRDYRQILMLADRHDWQAPFFGELAAAQAFEGLLRLTPPPRAAALRVLLAEHTRILSHLGFLGWITRDDPALTTRIRTAREALRGQMTRLTGNRIHPMAVRLGGMAVDPDPGWLHTQATLMESLIDLARALAELPLPGAGLATVDDALIDTFGLSGPMARAAGVALDARTHTYPPHDAPLSPAGTGAGDAQARFALLIAECHASALFVQAQCAKLPEGPVAVRLPKIIKLPEAESYDFVEGPLGRTGFHVVSRGDKTPWRMKLRSPSFHHVAALEVLLVGAQVCDVETILASVGYVVGDVDK